MQILVEFQMITTAETMIHGIQPCQRGTACTDSSTSTVERMANSGSGAGLQKRSSTKVAANDPSAASTSVSEP